MGSIPVPFERMAVNWPYRTSKSGEFGGKLAHPDLRAFMASIPGTPCCVQLSHALNMAGVLIPRGYHKQRRAPAPIKLKSYDGEVYRYLLCPDEIEAWLTLEYAEGDLVSRDGNGKKRTPAEIRELLQGRRGVIVFRTGAAGTVGSHAELWDGVSTLQKDMAVTALLGSKRVLFWDAATTKQRHLEYY